MNTTILWISAIILILIGTILTISYFIKRKQPVQSFLSIIGSFLIILTFSLGYIWWENQYNFNTPNDHSNPPNDQNDNENKDDNQQDEDNPQQEPPRKPDKEQPTEEPPTKENPSKNEDKDPEPEVPPIHSMDDYYDEASGTYTVQKGDTLWAISQYFKVTVDELKVWNDIADTTIKIGQQLNVDGPPIEQPPTTPPNPIQPSIFITHGNLHQKEIALTFDAGSDIGGIDIIDVLKKHQIKSTFFLTGRWVELFPDYARKLVTDGHEIANHSYAHEDFTQISHSERLKSIQKTDDAIKSVMGVEPVPFFRFPYGAYDQDALKSVGEAGYTHSIQWTIDTIDWQQPDVETIANRILENASSGDIVLMHIGAINTPEAVDYVIPILKEQGYRFVTISEILD